MLKPVDVACAVIVRNGKFLICKRSERMELPLKWEFPGGKIEKNETPIQAVIREMKEELNMYVHVFERLTPIEWEYPRVSQWVKIYPYWCTVNSIDEPYLVEHEAYEWVSPSNFGDYDWAQADILIVQEVLNKVGLDSEQFRNL